MSPSEPTVISGRYLLRSFRRRTLFSEDHLAHDQLLDRPVVFKALHPHLVRDRAFVERFRERAQAAAKVTTPGLAAVLDWGRDPAGFHDRPGPTYYLVSEDVDARTATELVADNGPMPLDRALHVLTGVTTALAHVHRDGLVHGGLTPDDVTVDRNGAVRIHDLGLSLALGDTWQPADDDPRAAYWRSPEQLRGETIDARSDVYQVGLLAYFLVTGRPPFPGATTSVVRQRQLELVPPAPTRLVPTLDRGVVPIIGKSLAKGPDERYPDLVSQRAAILRFRSLRVEQARDGRGDEVVTPADPPSPRRAPEVVTPVAPTAPTAPVTDRVDDLATPAIEVPSRIVEPASAPAVDDDATSLIATGGAAAESDDADDDGTVLITRPAASTPDPDAAPSTPSAPVAAEGAVEAAAKSTSPSRRKRVRLALTLGAFVVLVGLLVVMARQLGIGAGAGRTAVPNVVGRSSADAQATLSAAGFPVEIVERANAKVPADEVIAQDPEAGLVVSRDKTVIVQVSTGTESPTIPNLVGDTADTARSKLYAAGFVAQLTEREDDTAVSGNVIEQKPAAGAAAKPGATVEVVIAKASGVVEVADVAGRTPDDARLTLTRAGFRISVQLEGSKTVAKGTTIRTDPAAGQKIDRGSTVIIYVSGGPSAPVPSVIGRTAAQAEQQLTDLGFKVDVRERPVTNDADVDKVVSQTPAGGNDADPGSTVVIRVGVRGAPSSSEPASTVPASAVPTSISTGQ